LARTPSGGAHLYFTAHEHIEIRNAQGARGRGTGPGLDWRGTGGYLILPSLGSGYRWDLVCNLDTVPLALVPADLSPRYAAGIDLHINHVLGKPLDRCLPAALRKQGVWS
jgi:hypothetical protein